MISNSLSNFSWSKISCVHRYVVVREERERKIVKSRAALGSSLEKKTNYKQEKDIFWTSVSVIFTNMCQRYSKFVFDMMLERPVWCFDIWLCVTVAPRVFFHYMYAPDDHIVLDVYYYRCLLTAGAWSIVIAGCCMQYFRFRTGLLRKKCC